MNEENLKKYTEMIEDLGYTEFTKKSVERDLKNYEIVKHIREYLKVMESEPAEDLIKLKDVYHNLRRILGDE